MGTGAPIGPLFNIPDFTISGVLPPYMGPTPVIAAAMSPYTTSLTRIATKICASAERKEIMRGLINYRQRLAAIGLVNGVQWLSGSFMEDIESLETRAPRDVDIVTFCHRPAHLVGDDAAWNAFFNTNLPLFDRVQTKAAFKCDAFFVDLDSQPMAIVSLTRYWFGLFSHRRGGLWKGLLQIPLDVTQDDSDASSLVTP